MVIGGWRKIRAISSGLGLHCAVLCCMDGKQKNASVVRVCYALLLLWFGHMVESRVWCLLFRRKKEGSEGWIIRIDSPFSFLCFSMR